MNFGMFHNGPVTYITELKDPNMFLTAGDDGKLFIWDTQNKKMISKLQMDCHVTCGAIDKDGSYVILGTKKGTIRILDISSVTNVRIVMIKKINLKKPTIKVTISHDGTMVAILNAHSKRVLLMSAKTEDNFHFYGFAKLPGVMLDMCWSQTVRPPVNITQNNKILECVIKNGLLVAIVPPNNVKICNQINELSSDDVLMFGRKIDFDITQITVCQKSGDVYTVGDDRIVKKYKQPEEYLPKMDMRVKVPINPLEEFEGHDLLTNC